MMRSSKLVDGLNLYLCIGKHINALQMSIDMLLVVLYVVFNRFIVSCNKNEFSPIFFLTYFSPYKFKIFIFCKLLIECM